jgi:hypothetical protein
MKAVSEDIKDILLSESSLGLSFADDLFVGKEPHEPDNCVTIFDIPGDPPQVTMDVTRYDYPAVQIRCRNNDYMQASQQAYDIMEVLHGRSHEIVNGNYISSIIAQSDPQFFDWDQENRARFILKIKIQRR